MGLSARPLCVHASLRSFGWVEDGPAAVVDGLLAEGCTVLVPAFADVYRIPPPPDSRLRPARNGCNYERPPPPATELVYSPESQEIETAEMGAIPTEVIRRPERVRGNHPIDSFAAVGRLAEELIQGQHGHDPYAPLRALGERGGWVLLMGVGLNRMTLLHEAERQAGRNLFMRWANGPDGRPIGVESGGCSAGFPRLEPLLGPLARETVVGSSRWRAFPLAETLARAAAAIRRDPEITRCEEDCWRCGDAIAGGPILDEG
jgi:aminoglycoside 3-N-acetyltransferase